MDVRDYFRLRLRDPRVLLVEGRDDDDFLQALCKAENLEGRVRVLFYRLHGDLSTCLTAFANADAFEAVEVIGLTRDSDNGAEAAKESLVSAWNPVADKLRLLGRRVPKAHFFALPDNSGRGRIEDLCLRSPTHPAVMTCAEELYGCATKVVAYKVDREKSLVAAYLSMMERPGMRLGVGALRDYWNLDSEALRPLRDFIRLVAGITTG